jgi:hypothetical protein
MKNWIGKWVMFVALGHTVVAFAFFATTYRGLLERGLFNTVTSEKAGMAVWFGLGGLLLFIVGMLVSALEKQGLRVPVPAGLALLSLTLIGVVLMPVSGFWLMIPAIIAIFYRRSH